MVKVETEFYWMTKRVQLRCANNSVIVNGYNPFKADALKLNIDIAALELIMPAELIIGTGYTLDQNVAKNICSKFWDVNVCKTLKGFALKYGSNTYFQEVDFTESKLDGISIKKYYEVITNLNTACAKIIIDPRYVGAGYAVTPAVLTAGMTLANAFLSTTGQAAQIIGSRKQNGEAIRVILKTLQTDCTVMDYDVYGIGNSVFMGQFLNDRKIGKSVIHNTINFIALDALTRLPVNRVYVINQGATRGNYTNIDGMVALYKKAGTNILVCSHKNPKTKLVDYEPQTVRVTAVYKKSVTFTVTMQPLDAAASAEAAEKATDDIAKKKAAAKKPIVADTEVKEAAPAKEAVAKKEVVAKKVVKKGKGKK